MPRTLSYELTVQAPPEAVYEAFTIEALLSLWFADHVFAYPHVGASFLYVWNGANYHAAGVFTALERPTRIAYTWQGRGEPSETQVKILLTPTDGGTHVLLTHEGIGEGEAWDNALQLLDSGWKYALRDLKPLLEQGINRVDRRPLVGAFLETLTPELQAKANVPVSYGMFVNSLVDGLAGANAGLQTGDVITMLDGRPLDGYNAFTGIIGAHEAGDTIPVEYYRAGEKRMTSMTLSPRPRPDVPTTAVEAAARLSEAHSTVNAELDALIEDVPESTLAQHPKPGEWSVNENLAHLIFTERYTQVWLWNAVDKELRLNWTSNNATQIAGILVAYPTGAELLAAFKLAEKETAAATASLPESFVSNRALFARAWADLVYLPDHTREHIEQIRHTIATVRPDLAQKNSPSSP